MRNCEYKTAYQAFTEEGASVVVYAITMASARAIAASRLSPGRLTQCRRIPWADKYMNFSRIPDIAWFEQGKTVHCAQCKRPLSRNIEHEEYNEPIISGVEVLCGRDCFIAARTWAPKPIMQSEARP